LGRSITTKTRNLLSWCGVDNEQIQRWSLESLQHKDLLDFTQVKKERVKIKFNDHVLPEGEIVDSNNLAHKSYVDYLTKRKIDTNDYPFLITPNEFGRMANRVIIPYTYKNKIVGHTSRFLDNKIPKYINEQQQGYVFNLDAQKPEWIVCIVTEGIFDALSIDGVAVMHDEISNDQAQLLSTLNKQIIVVPDRDKTGLKMCDRALELGYQVSLPEWDIDIKDVNDAVVKYGKLPTLLSILHSATNSKIKIEMQRKKIAKGL
jgi:DNA primase